MIVWLVILLLVILALIDSLQRDGGNDRKLNKELRRLRSKGGRKSWLAGLRRAISNE